ncbi:MAG: class I SAM-dependent methyltransferase [Clostridia bacterium]|nr:class I SAM-dependent methyltransferase [Clostridia bacterium]
MEYTRINDAVSLENLDFNRYDYLDFGCSSGNSLSYGSKYFGGTACLGVDIDQEKIAEAQEKIRTGKIKGQHAAVCMDVLQLP